MSAMPLYPDLRAVDLWIWGCVYKTWIGDLLLQFWLKRIGWVGGSVGEESKMKQAGVMECRAQLWMVVALLCALAGGAAARGFVQEGGSACESLQPSGLQKKTFLSPPLTFRPGEVRNKYFVVDAPKGHLGIRDFHAELVDEKGVSVLLSDVYLHHWVMYELSVPSNDVETHKEMLLKSMEKKHTLQYHSTSHAASLEAAGTGLKLADGHRMMQYFGVGGETRRTKSTIPAPFARETAAPSLLAEGYEPMWILNVHGLDTRGAVNTMGCTECRCDLYNVTVDRKGNPLSESYVGGLECCTDGRRCAVKEGFEGDELEMTIYLQYTWEYVTWDECVEPLSSISMNVVKQVEYTVEGCGHTGCGNTDPASQDCVDTRESTLVAPFGGDLIFAVSHLHASALDSTLFGEDGRVICHAPPIYGTGQEAGNEMGYVVGIVSCYPGNEVSKIVEGERLRLEVKYSKVGGPHSGVMGLMGLHLAAGGIASVV